MVIKIVKKRTLTTTSFTPISSLGCLETLRFLDAETSTRRRLASGSEIDLERFFVFVK